MAARVVLGLLLVLAPTLATAQQSRCADCHFANPGAPGHLSDWDTSPHGRNAVGCDACHGGNPATFERAEAHRGILSRGNPASPIHRENIPTTCGKCHVGPFVEFQKSRHFALLQTGDPRVPICTSCHETVGAHVLSPAGLERECAGCHKPDGPVGREFPGQGRLMVYGISTARADLDEAKSLIKRVKDKTLRTGLEDDYRQAEVPLIEAGNAGHAFVFTELQERLAVARTRIEALLDRLANR